jgi:hypothetical protein
MPKENNNLPPGLAGGGKGQRLKGFPDRSYRQIVLGTHPILGAWTSIAGSQIPCKAGNIRDGMAV